MKSDEIEAIQDECRLKEESSKQEFLKINNDYMEKKRNGAAKREEELRAAWADAVSLVSGCTDIQEIQKIISGCGAVGETEETIPEPEDKISEKKPGMAEELQQEECDDDADEEEDNDLFDVDEPDDWQKGDF